LRIVHQLAQQRTGQALRLAFHHCGVKIIEDSDQNGGLAIQGFNPYGISVFPRH
jgi:hypothetical protein